MNKNAKCAKDENKKILKIGTFSLQEKQPMKSKSRKDNAASSEKQKLNQH